VRYGSFLWFKAEWEVTVWPRIPKGRFHGNGLFWKTKPFEWLHFRLMQVPMNIQLCHTDHWEVHNYCSCYFRSICHMNVPVSRLYGVMAKFSHKEPREVPYGRSKARDSPRFGQSPTFQSWGTIPIQG
jgi:hypothetical protein